MRRYYLNKESLDLNDNFQIDGELFHHIFDVCRQQVGSKFELLTTSGDAFFVEVTEVYKKQATVVIKEKRSLPKPKPPWIHLVLSVPKIATFESILEKSVEMGVKSIHPLVSDFSFVKSLQNYPHDKEKRWLKIIQQATQQSARGDQLVLENPKTLEQFLKLSPWKLEHNLGVFAFEGECPSTLKNYIENWKAKNAAGIHLQNIWIIVGSEGGFSKREVDIFKQLDLQPVTLGEQVLRVETACMALISALKYELGGN